MKMDKGRVGEIIAKTQAFYDTKAEGCALIKVKDIATQPGGVVDLTQYSFPKDTYRFLDLRAENYIARLEKRAGLFDDTVPAEGPWYGIAEQVAFLGGKVHYEPQTSFLQAFLEEPGEVEKLLLDENNEILKMVTNGIAYMREKYGDYFCPMVRGTSCAMEMANALRGNEFFYDFYEDPEGLGKLLDYCAEALVWYYEHQLAAAGDCFGGVVTGFGEWLPGHSIGHVTEDITTMISVEQFEEFAKPRTESIYRRYDKVFLHMHALGERALASASSMPNICLMELSSDPNTDRAIDVWRRNRETIAKVIPVLRLTREEIKNNMDILKTQKTVIWYDAASMEDAKDMCAFIEKELPVR